MNMISSVSMVSGRGVFVEEIDKQLKEHNLDIPFIGIDETNLEKSIENLQRILGGL